MTVTLPPAGPSQPPEITALLAQYRKFIAERDTQRTYPDPPPRPLLNDVRDEAKRHLVEEVRQYHDDSQAKVGRVLARTPYVVSNLDRVEVFDRAYGRCEAFNKKYLVDVQESHRSRLSPCTDTACRTIVARHPREVPRYVDQPGPQGGLLDIYSIAEDGPRRDADRMGWSDRKNLLLVCPRHLRTINNDPGTYTAGLLESWQTWHMLTRMQVDHCAKLAEANRRMAE